MARKTESFEGVATPRLTIRQRWDSSRARVLYDIYQISPGRPEGGYILGSLVEAGFTSRLLAARRRDQISREMFAQKEEGEASS